MYQILTIPDNANEYPEQVGSKYKFWYANQTKMFKAGRDNTGEDWAEKIACELCSALGLPHAKYELANWRDLRGTCTENFALPPGRLVLGNELLASFVSDYPGTNRYRQKQHTIGRACAVMNAKNLGVPIGWAQPAQALSPLDIFIGYVLLDAWIGNTDRHHENWGVIALNGAVYLAPTFDHASSLGRELSDSKRMEKLTTKDRRSDLQAYLSKARSAFFRSASDLQALPTMEAFHEASRRSGSGRNYWLDKLSGITDSKIVEIVDAVPECLMTGAAREFACALLKKNRDTLLSGMPEI